MISPESGRPIESKPCKMAPFGQGKRGTSLIPLLLFAFGFLGLSIGLLIFSLYRSGYALSAQSQVNCQSLKDQAISYTGKYCNKIGANEGCYGNTTLQGQMIANANQRFSERGDVADISQIQSISADPLNLMTQDWGIAIFRVLGNLPGTVPGEMVTLMVFGNTKLDKTSTGLDSFYFSSELGQIVCGKVPMDGILINMPNGAGWIFDVNGAELTLMGNASLEANKNGTMVVGLYNGAGQITSDGQTQPDDYGSPPPSGGEQHSPTDGCGQGVFVVILSWSNVGLRICQLQIMQLVGVIQATIHHHTERIAQKEKSHVVDYHRNSSNPVAARLFRSEHKSRLPANRRLDSHSDRYRSHPHHITPAGYNVNISRLLENCSSRPNANYFGFCHPRKPD